MSRPELAIVPLVPGTPPGLLTADAWDAVRAADLVAVATEDDRWRGALADAGASVADGAPSARRLAGPGPDAGARDSRPMLAWLCDAADAAGSLGEGERERALAWARGEGSGDGPEEAEVRLVAGTPAYAGGQLLRSIGVMDALRDPSGDAWSAAQTHVSLARYLLEETHEVLEALERPGAPDDAELAGELGDLWFQILFHARLGAERAAADGGAAAGPTGEHAGDGRSRLDIDEVGRRFVEKMLRRNPHVFGPGREQALARRDDIDAIIAQWHEAKAREGSGQGLLDSVPAALPALQRASKAVHRARTSGRLDALLRAADDAAPRIDGGARARALLDAVVEAEALDQDAESQLRALLAAAVRDAEGARSDAPASDGDGAIG